MENFNLRCEQFKQQILKDINECNLPISSAYFICNNIFQELEKQYYATLNAESMKSAQTEEVDIVKQDIEDK